MVSGVHFHYQEARTARLLIVAAVLFVFLAVVLVPMLAGRGLYGVLASIGLVVGGVALAMLAFTHAPDAGIMFERDMLKKFRAVCKEKHLTTKDDKTGRLNFPLTSQLIVNGEIWSMLIRPLPGQSMTDWEKTAEPFRMHFRGSEVRFTEAEGGCIRMSAGYRPMDAVSFRPVVERVPDDELDLRQQLKSVPVGRTEPGAPYCLPIIDSHTLVVGITGSGKGSVVWSALCALAPYVRTGEVKLWGLDPKCVELAQGRDFFGDRYASGSEEMVELLERMHDEMKATAKSMQGKKRRFDPSATTPFNLMIIDELAYLSAYMTDKKLRARADEALCGILVLGRAIGYGVIGATQDPRKEVISYRDLFPTRVALRLSKPMVDLVLGNGMHEAGAKCDLIPPPEAGGAGIGFVLAEGSSTPLCVRMTWCSDELISSIAGSLGGGDSGTSPLPIGA